jgi:hypothetical protein
MTAWIQFAREKVVNSRTDSSTLLLTAQNNKLTMVKRTLGSKLIENGICADFWLCEKYFRKLFLSPVGCSFLVIKENSSHIFISFAWKSMRIVFSRFLLKKSLTGNLGATTRLSLSPLSHSRKLSQPYSNSTSNQPSQRKITMSDLAPKDGAVNLHKDPYLTPFIGWLIRRVTGEMVSKS